MEGREAEDGRRLLGFYTSEAEEEIRGVGFVNQWRRVSPKMEIELLGFANRKPKKRFATSVSRKDRETLANLKGGSN